MDIMQKLQVPSSCGLGMVEKWHVTQDTRHVTHDTLQVVLSASYIPKTICLVSNLSIISKNTHFFLNFIYTVFFRGQKCLKHQLETTETFV